jgi:hypothetical protein
MQKLFMKKEEVLKKKGQVFEIFKKMDTPMPA